MNIDITIVGSGLIGASLALALKDKGFTIALIDKIPFLPNPIANVEDARALALSLPSVACLKVLDIWPIIEKTAGEILEVHISKQGYFGSTRIKAKDMGLPTLGYVVNADYLNQILNDKILQCDSINIFRPSEIIHLKKQEKHWQVVLDSGQILSTQLLVAADGTESPLRKQQGFGVHIEDHRQTALVANIELDQVHHNTAYERFTTTGSLAMLPFGGSCTKVKCVWAVPNIEVDNLQSLSSTEFLKVLQNNFGYRLGRLLKVGKRIRYPLRTMTSPILYDDRFVLIGNAANTLHPIAAQGFNMGLRDVATLAELLVTAQQNHQDIASIELLRTYANMREKDQHAIRQLCLYLGEPNLLQWLGIIACEGIFPVKRFIANLGSGKQQVLPKLCRGVSLS